MIYIISIFRHLLEKLDGKIVWKAPRGPIGTAIKALNDHLLDAIVDFQPLPTKIPMVEPTIFSEACNRQRLAEILAGISLGRDSILEKFWLTEYPVISTLRWLTTAERICGVFIRDPNPSEELMIMMVFIPAMIAAAEDLIWPPRRRRFGRSWRMERKEIAARERITMGPFPPRYSHNRLIIVD